MKRALFELALRELGYLQLNREYFEAAAPVSQNGNGHHPAPRAEVPGGLLDVHQLAARIGCSPKFIYEHAHARGGIPHLKVGKFLRFNLETVQAWLRDQEQ